VVVFLRSFLEADMKCDYLVWLKSGSCPEGRAEESEIDKLIVAWQNPQESPFCSISDDDGTTAFKTAEIVTIAKNRIIESKIAGY
jgi:hypothetical protein